MKEIGMVVGGDGKTVNNKEKSTQNSHKWVVPLSSLVIIVGVPILLGLYLFRRRVSKKSIAICALVVGAAILILVLSVFASDDGDKKQGKSDVVKKPKDAAEPKECAAEPKLLLPPCASEPPPAKQDVVVKTDPWAAFHGRDIYWFHISNDGSTITDTTLDEDDPSLPASYTGISEKATVVRNGLAFFFADFEKNCQASKDEKGDWIVSRENEYIKIMDGKKMKNFRNLINSIPGMRDFIPNVLSPRNRELRSDGRPNNRSGEYRIDPLPGRCSDDPSCYLDAMD